LEEVAAEEVTEKLRAKVKRSGRGFIVFRPAEITSALLEIRTIEDVFLLMWGTDQLSFRAKDLELIERWTAKDADWARGLAMHHRVRPKPRGKPSYHLVAQMQGKHGYRRIDALEAMARGLSGKFPASWRPVEEEASIEVWLTIDGTTALCGLRLSDRTLRHRTYKEDHVPASLRPVVAAAMVRLADVQSGQILLDPMCGAGTILAEQLLVDRKARILGGDLEHGPLRAACTNLAHLGTPRIARWDARRLPLADQSVHRIVCNPPFGIQLSTPEELEVLYARLIQECDRVLKHQGKAVFLVAKQAPLEVPAKAHGWHRDRKLRVFVQGQPALLSVWRKTR
jgi:23S rRNA G2445 N2-methylase RlmL